MNCAYYITINGQKHKLFESGNSVTSLAELKFAFQQYLTNNNSAEIKNLIEKFKNFEEELVVIGGERIYNEFLEYANEFHITYINKRFDKVDRYFPEIDLTDFEIKQVIDNKEFIYKYYKRKL